MGKLSDQDHVRLHRRLLEIFRCTDQGLLKIDSVMVGLQFILNGEVGRGIYPDNDGGNMFIVKVNHDLSLADMIRAGKYQKVRLELSDLAKQALAVGSRGVEEVRIQLFHFGRMIGTVEVAQELEKSGCRPATIPELLAIGAQYPMRQKQCRIATIEVLAKVLMPSEIDTESSSVRHTEFTAQIPGVCLFTSQTTGERICAEYSGFMNWSQDCRFAAVHK